ncbi:MAG TPA: glycosyltransferase family 1 protein [Sphingomicrobium sp.]|nr:glycosyltransferase family 1 protein [Sphingomicrobium sp.]
MKIVIATDAWHPQVNGVVRSLETTAERLKQRGHDVMMVEPGMFRTIPCPTYAEIRLALRCGKAVAAILDRVQPDRVHVSTEGPIGWATRSWCLKRGRPFTTAFHTRFPDYVSIRTGIPAEWIWKVMRRFHGPAERTFTATATLADELQSHGIEHTHHWPRGVDLDQFSSNVCPHPSLFRLPRPLLLNVGRVAVEKNIEAFLDCQVAGSKVVVGDGPALETLKKRYPEVTFMGAKHGAELASCYAAADVFVFPSRTDTFGLVNIEALACGVPVAAFPVPGPIDILGPDGKGFHGSKGRIGAVDEDLGAAIRRALTADRAAAAAEARHYSWDCCTDRFIEGLAAELAEQHRFAA